MNHFFSFAFNAGVHDTKLSSLVKLHSCIQEIC